MAFLHCNHFLSSAIENELVNSVSYQVLLLLSMMSFQITKTLFCFIDSAVLAHFLLKEKLRKLGVLGCGLCVVGSTVIVLHAPGEHSISSVEEIWELAIQPGERMYSDR